MEVLPKRLLVARQGGPERHRPPRPGASSPPSSLSPASRWRTGTGCRGREIRGNTDPVCLPSGNGYLKARLAGEINSDIDWVHAGTSCEGMPRPNGRGLRLSFRAHRRSRGHRLVIVFGRADR